MGYCICVGGDNYSLSSNDATSNEVWGDRTSTPNSGNVDLVEVVVSHRILALPLSIILSLFRFSLSSFFFLLTFFFVGIINKGAPILLNYIAWCSVSLVRSLS